MKSPSDLVARSTLLILWLIPMMQVAAAIAFFAYYLEWWFIPAVIVGSLIGWSPLIGTVIGILGAHLGWGLGWMASLGLFFGPALIFFGAISIASRVASQIEARRKSKTIPKQMAS